MAERQQLYKLAQATSDDTGAATFTFEPVQSGYAWAGNVQVPGSPTGAQHVVTVADITWGAFLGTLPYGNILVPSLLSAQITSVGLLPNTAYTANFLGVSDLSSQVPPIMPAPVAAAVAPQTELTPAGGVQQFGAGTANLGPYNVAAFGGVVIGVFTDRLGLGGVIHATVDWSAPDGQGGYDTIAQRNFIVDADSSGVLRVPNYGPILRVFADLDSGTVGVVKIVGITQPVTAETWSNDAPGGLGDLPDTGVLIDSGLVSIANGVTSVVGGTAFTYAGPVSITLLGATPATWRFDVMDQTGTFVNKWNLVSTDLPSSGLAGGPAHAVIPWIAPARPWRVRTTNSSGSTNSYAAYVTADHR